jgi:tetratricopeptide (TPR) repeat protein
MSHYQKKLIIILNLLCLSGLTIQAIPSYANSGIQATSKPLNMRIIREDFDEFCDSLVIPEEKQKIKLDSLYFNDLNLSENNIEYKEIFSVHNDKYIPDALKAIRKRESEQEYISSSKDASPVSSNSPMVYNVSLSSQRHGIQTINLGNGSTSYMYSMMNSNDKDTQFNFDKAIEKVKAAISQNDFSSAGEYLDDLRIKSKANNARLIVLAGLYEKINKPEEACGIYKEITDAEPAKPDYLYNYALCLYKNDNYDMAEKFFLKVTELKPDYMNAYYNLGNLYYKKSDYYKALDYFNKAMELSPNNSDIYFNIAATLELLEHKTLAKKFYNKCLELNPEDKQAEQAVARLD